MAKVKENKPLPILCSNQIAFRFEVHRIGINLMLCLHWFDGVLSTHFKKLWGILI